MNEELKKARKAFDAESYGELWGIIEDWMSYLHSGLQSENFDQLALFNALHWPIYRPNFHADPITTKLFIWKKCVLHSILDSGFAVCGPVAMDVSPSHLKPGFGPKDLLCHRMFYQAISTIKPGFHTLVSNVRIVSVAECFVKRYGRLSLVSIHLSLT